MLAAGVATVPPAAPRADVGSWRQARPALAGAFHVHTNRSDGSGSIDDVAAAASRAGLQFVIVTDHGDGTGLERPAYRSGVLMIDGVEIRTIAGHYAAVGMETSPYPLGGEAHGVIEDVARLGGFGVVAHGDSPKPDLQWTDPLAGEDAVEWVNLDSVWRQATNAQVARAVVGYWFRPPETLALPMARPDDTLDRFDAHARSHRVLALAATDAHGTLASSYEACFRAMSTRVELPAPLRGDASADARGVIAALRAGHHYSVVDAVARPSAFEFVGLGGRAVVRTGDIVPVGHPLTLVSRIAGPPGTMQSLLRDGVVIAETTESELVHHSDGRRGVYRVEARLVSAAGRRAMPFVVSNPMFVGLPGGTHSRAVTAAHAADLIAPAVKSLVWHTEHDSSSSAAPSHDPSIPELRLRFALGGGAPQDQFAALVLPVPAGFAKYDRISMHASASAPLRLSVQLRELGNRNPPRWRRSIYLDETPRTISVSFSDMTPVAPNVTARVPASAIGGLMLVVETTNTTPGTKGSVVFSSLTLEAS